MNTALGFGNGYTLYPVDTTFILQMSEDTFSRVSGIARNTDVDILIAAQIRFGGRNNFCFPTAMFCVAQIHASQIRGKQGSLFAAFTTFDAKNHIPGISRSTWDATPVRGRGGGFVVVRQLRYFAGDIRILLCDVVGVFQSSSQLLPVTMCLIDRCAFGNTATHSTGAGLVSRHGRVNDLLG